jgi:hypothetical protein
MDSLSSRCRFWRCVFSLGERARPNLRPHHAQHRFIFGVDGDERVNEEAQACPVAPQPQSTAALVAPGKVDLGRVLRHHHAPAATSSRRARSSFLQDRLRGHPLRTEESMGANLSRAIRAKLPNHQRARLRDVLKYLLKPTRNPNIAAKTNTHHGLPEHRRGA